MYYRVLHCLVIESVNEKCLSLPSQFRFERTEPLQLLGFAKNFDYELTPRFLRASAEKGDECYAIMDGEQLASYGWYSRRPTLLDNEDLILRFGSGYVYMYKGFTAPAYRGHRLHAIGMTRSLAAYKAQGFKGLVSYVESNNFDSLRSCYRMGYQFCGQMRVARVAGRYYFKRQPLCEQYGLALEMNRRFPRSQAA